VRLFFVHTGPPILDGDAPSKVQCLRLASESGAPGLFTVRARTVSTRKETRRQLAAARKAGVADVTDTSRNKTLPICILLVIATFALYSPTLSHLFIGSYDDDSYVTNNAHVQAGLTWETITWAVTSTEFSNWHPLTWLSHAADCEMFGLNPVGHHFTNVLLHAMSVVLLYLLLLRATGSKGRSLLVAALFAVHPFNVESVAWIAERKNVLSTFFFLLTLGVYGWYALRPTIGRYLAVAASFALGLAAKPMVVTLPFVLLLLDYWPLGRIQGLSTETQDSPFASGREVTQLPFWKLCLEKLPLLALSAADSAITMYAQKSYGSMRLSLSLGVRLENAIYAYAMYIWKTFWPARLAVFYPHPGANLGAWRTGLAAAFLLAISAIVWRERARRRYLVTGWLWFLGTLVPVIGLVQVGEQAMADRYAYVPLIGIFLMIVWGAADLADARQLRFATRAKAAGAALALLAVVTLIQISYWQDSLTLWSHAVDVTKDNYNAEVNLGVTLMSTDRPDEALPHLQNATRIRPNNGVVHLNIAAVYAMENRDRDAIAEFQKAIELRPPSSGLIVAYEGLGRAYGRLGNYADARANYERALQLDPNKTSAKEGLSNVEFSEAMRDASESPSADHFLRLGQLLQQRGHPDQARTAYEQALELNPHLSAAQDALASLSGK